jgi:hypothetical protein
MDERVFFFLFIMLEIDEDTVQERILIQGKVLFILVPEIASCYAFASFIFQKDLL